MKACITAGGLGTRLAPLSLVTNKHLLPVAHQPLIYYPLQKLVESGITEVLLITGGNNAGKFLEVLGDGKQFGLTDLHYTYQSQPKGIGDALKLAQDWAEDGPLAVMLGDNIFEDSFREEIKKFQENQQGAQIFLKEVKNPQWYGVVDVDETGKVIKITEKPKVPTSNLAVTGFYLYNASVWEKLNRCKVSPRGEIEVSDLNNLYIQEGNMQAHQLKGWWLDAGESLQAYMDAFVKIKELNGMS